MDKIMPRRLHTPPREAQHFLSLFEIDVARQSRLRNCCWQFSTAASAPIVHRRMWVYRISRCLLVELRPGAMTEGKSQASPAIRPLDL